MKGIECFKKLTIEEQSYFKENTGKEFNKIMTSNFLTWELFIWFSGFDWSESNQGFKYWYEISKRYKN
jgi:hypothetical protein